MAKKKLTKAEREVMNARHERMLANARRTRELAEKAQAKLDRDARATGREADGPRPRPVPAWLTTKKLTKAERAEFHEQVLANARRTRELAEKAQAKLDAQRSRG
jgi:hypothetical protein